MALHWDFKKKVGEADFVTKWENENGEKETLRRTINLYEGNAYLIFINEYTDERTGEDMYALHSFFVDKDHAKNMLGLNPKNGYADNLLKTKREFMTRIILDKTKFSSAKKLRELVGLLVDAFDELDIRIAQFENETETEDSESNVA